MSDGHILWIAEAKRYPGEREYLFFFDPVMGLCDVDMHRVTDDGWRHMAAKDDESTAHLTAPPFATMDEVGGALKTLADKGRFKRVRITVRAL